MITNRAGADIIESQMAGNRLGDLELEKRSNNVTLYALKDYNFGKDRRRKSIPRDSKKIGKGKYSFTKWSTTIEAMESGRRDAMTTRKETKTLHRSYEKGVPLPDGSIRPIRLSVSRSPKCDNADQKINKDQPK